MWHASNLASVRTQAMPERVHSPPSLGVSAQGAATPWHAPYQRSRRFKGAQVLELNRSDDQSLRRPLAIGVCLLLRVKLLCVQPRSV